MRYRRPGFLVPADGLRGIFGYDFAFAEEVAEIIFCAGVAEFFGAAVIPQGFFAVYGDAKPQFIGFAQVVERTRLVCFRRSTVPAQGSGIVLFDTKSIGIEICQFYHGGGIAQFSRFAVTVGGGRVVFFLSVAVALLA